MIVAFYSDVRGCAGTTSNLCSIATYLALVKNMRLVLWENHCNWNTISGNMISQKKRHTMLRQLHEYQVNGAKELMIDIKTSQRNLEQSSIISYSSELYMDKLYYLSNSSMDSYLYEKEMMQILPNLLTYLKHCDSTVFIDIQNLEKESSRYILDQADLVIKNMTQNSRTYSFLNRLSEDNQKYRYLFGSYHSDSRNNTTNFIRGYEVAPEHVAIIPYSTSYLEACSKGQVISFIQDNIQCNSYDNNYIFIQALIQASNMVYKAIEKMSFEKNGMVNRQKNSFQNIAYVNSIEGRCEDCYI